MKQHVCLATGVLAGSVLMASVFAAPPAPKAGAKTAGTQVAVNPAGTAPAASITTKTSPTGGSTQLDRLLAEDNSGRKLKTIAPAIDDLAFLRRVSIDLIGRIPSEPEINDFLAASPETRRAKAVDRLLKDPRYADRWTVFFADMLRIRSGGEGGRALMAYVHNAVETGMAYDELVRKLLSLNGRANMVPELGFILGDEADPMALAGATAQTFLGIRIACAQCHDHPFDSWTREQFYGFAAYFGNTVRVERRFKNNLLGVYTTDTDKPRVLWPPEGKAPASERQPMKPAFPFDLEAENAQAPHITRLVALRAEEKAKRDKELARAKSVDSSVDDLLNTAAKTASKRTNGPAPEDDSVIGEAKADVASINLQMDAVRASQLRKQMSELITSPRNRAFARAFVNRVWAELIGKGLVEPLDDFSNPISHQKTMDYMADEFVASGYDLRSLIRLITTSQVYQRGRVASADEATRQELENAFASAPMRRMNSEVLYDSVVMAGHLFDVKHEAGKNLKVDWVLRQVPKATSNSNNLGAKGNELASAAGGKAMPGKMGAKPEMDKKPASYDLETALEVDFKQVLKTKGDPEPEVEQMRMVSKEELEAEEELRKMQARRAGMSFVDSYSKAIIDDNPKFSSAMRMPSPAAPSHFLRVFGQPARDGLGQFRDQSSSMRQALMMLNGRLSNEAARVGELEPVYEYLAGEKPNLDKAIELVYLEIFTRKPTPSDVQDAKEIIAAAANPRDGMADLRWVMLNSHEFRFVP